VATESKTQGPGEEDWVRPAKYVPMCTTNTMELEDYWSLYHLRNLLNIVGASDETKEGGFPAYEGQERSAWTTATDRGGRSCNA